MNFSMLCHGNSSTNCPMQSSIASSTGGGMGPETITFYKRFCLQLDNADHILFCVGFSLLKLATLCIRGTMSSRHPRLHVDMLDTVLLFISVQVQATLVSPNSCVDVYEVATFCPVEYYVCFNKLFLSIRPPVHPLVHSSTHSPIHTHMHTFSIPSISTFSLLSFLSSC